MTHKPTIIPEKLNRVHFSLQKLCLLSQMMIMENYCELIDTKFAIPTMNNFCKRIINDSKAIQQLLTTQGYITIKNKNESFVEDYSSQLWRVITLLAGLDIELVREFADNLEKELEAAGV